MLTFALNPLFWWAVTGMAAIALIVLWLTDPERKRAATSPVMPVLPQAPRTKTWVSKLDATVLFSRSNRLALVRSDWARKYDVKNPMQEAVMLMENPFAEKDREVMVGGAIGDCFREVESQYPSVKKDGKYSKEILQWWLRREAIKL